MTKYPLLPLPSDDLSCPLTCTLPSASRTTLPHASTTTPDRWWEYLYVCVHATRSFPAHHLPSIVQSPSESRPCPLTSPTEVATSPSSRSRSGVSSKVSRDTLSCRPSSHSTDQRPFVSRCIGFSTWAPALTKSSCPLFISSSLWNPRLCHAHRSNSRTTEKKRRKMTTITIGIAIADTPCGLVSCPQHTGRKLASTTAAAAGRSIV
mmetsp:Transcript_7848/g.18453  ORF Transcript_7848/g.18453 Transcript_7848/m.18453 type:complete len:207 (-) Transcript_7848:101-721(-)